MHVGKVENINNNYRIKHDNVSKVNVDCSKSVDKSLYNTPGMNVYFCGLAKGLDVIEENCIKMLRKAREGRCRKFDEYDIRDILISLRKGKNPEQKSEILRDFLFYEDANGVKPDKKLFKQVIDIASDKSESERFALMEYLQNESENVIKPFEAFAKLPKNNQDKLVKILQKIDDVNDKYLFKSDDCRQKIINDLYDTFRVPVFAHDDLTTLKGAEADSCIVQALKLLREDLKCYERSDDFYDNAAKDKIVSIVKDIYNYTLENLL